MENIQQNILKAFRIYKDSVFLIMRNFKFYNSFLKLSIDNYMAQDYDPVEIYSSVFHAYDIHPEKITGLSKMYKISDHIRTDALHENSKSFMTSVANLALLKTYNAVEIFIYQAIQIKYFPSEKSPNGSRTATKIIEQKIKSFLANSGKLDTRNNAHLITFLKLKSSNIEWFLNEKVRIDLDTNWETFFELIGILRNLIGHHGTVMGSETRNEVKSKARDIFERFFNLIEDEYGHDNIQPNIEQFSNFISFYNDFAVNMVKFIFEAENFEIFDMY